MGFLLNAWIAFATLVFLGLVLIDVYGLLRKEKEGKVGNTRYKPKILVIIPCKGLDRDFYKNLVSIRNQNYKNYEIVSVLDDDKDPAGNVLKEAKIRSILTSSKDKKASGKVRAIITALERFRDYEVYVIADSDIRVERSWLTALVSPLHEKRVGLSTMYPYFVPEGGFWSRVKMVWGFVGDGLMSREESRFGWGGSLAFRKDLLGDNSLKFLKNSDFSVSDDICLTKISQEKGLAIAYTANFRPHIHSDDDFGRFSEWSSRQTALSILGYRRNFNVGVVFYFAEAFLVLSGIVLAVFVSPFFLIFFLHYLKSLIATYSKSKSEYRYLSLIPITMIMPFIYLVNLLMANSMGYIYWRGTRYQIKH